MSIQQYTRRAVQDSAPQSLSTEQLNRILSSSKEDPNLRDLYDVVTIISNTGIRSGELSDLRWSDVDVENRELVVNSKKSACIRRIHLGAQVLQILEARHERQPEQEYVLGKSRRWVLDRVARQLRAISDAAGVPFIQLRTLRRSFFTRLANSGASLQSLMAIGGWSSPELATMHSLNVERRHEIVVRDQARVEE